MLWPIAHFSPIYPSYRDRETQQSMTVSQRLGILSKITQWKTTAVCSASGNSLILSCLGGDGRKRRGLAWIQNRPSGSHWKLQVDVTWVICWQVLSETLFILLEILFGGRQPPLKQRYSEVSELITEKSTFGSCQSVRVHVFWGCSFDSCIFFFGVACSC